MSLVNEALRKARLEAARGEAASRGIPYPALGTGDRSSGQTWVVALALTLVLAGVTGFLLYRAGKRAALEQQTVAQPRPTASTRTTTADANPTQTQPADVLLEGRGPTTERPDQAQNSGVARRPAPVEGASPRSEPRASDSQSSVRQAVNEPRADPPAPVRDEPAGTSGATGAVATAQPIRETAGPQAVAPAAAAPEPLQDAGALPSEAPEAASDAAVREFVRRAEIPGVGPMELGGIAWSGDRPFALINGRVVRPGDSVLGLTVDTIEPNRVSLSNDAGRLIFRLK